MLAPPTATLESPPDEDERPPAEHESPLARTEVRASAAGAIAVMAVAAFVYFRGGSRVSIGVTGTTGGIGGFGYEFTGSVCMAICLAAAAAPVCAIAACTAARRETIRGDLVGSVLDTIGATPLASSGWTLLLLSWLVVTDLLGWVHNDAFAPTGRIFQLLIDELSSGRLVIAASTTVLRNLLAITIAAAGAIVSTLVLGDRASARSATIPWLRAMSLVPPVLIFAYIPYVGKLMLDPATRDMLAGIGGGKNAIASVIQNPDRLLALSSVAYWPLVTAALHGYSKIGVSMEEELRVLRLPSGRAARVKILAILHSLSPAFHIAVVLVFAVCMHAETAGAQGIPSDGLARQYLVPGMDYDARDILWLAVTILAGTGLLFLSGTDLVVAYLTGQRHTPYHERTQ